MPTLPKNPELLNLSGLVYMAETRGGKHALTCCKSALSAEAGGGMAWRFTDWTDGLQRGCSVRYSRADAIAHMKNRVRDSKADGINLTALWDTL